MTVSENNVNLEYYYLLPGFSTDSKGRRTGKPDFFNYDVLYFFDLNEKDGYVVTIEKVSFSKFRLLEKLQFIDDLQSEFIYDRDPFYLSISFDRMAEQMAEDYSNYYKNLCDKIMKRFLLSLFLVHPELDLMDPIDYVVYKLTGSNPGYLVSRYLGLFGREAYYIRKDQYVSLRDIETNIYSVYKVLETLEDRLPEYLSAALSIFVDSYKVHSITTKALYLLSIIELLFDESRFNISEIKMPDSNGRMVVANFSDVRNNLAHGREVSSNILSGLLELCQILFFDSLAYLCMDTDFSETIKNDIRKACSEQVVKYTNQNNYLFDRLRPGISNLGITPKFQNELQ